MNDDRTHILEFGKLWKMAIDVPYSTLVGKGVNAWSCGQLALSRAAQVLASGDLKAQAEIVCTYLEQILLASDLDVTNVRRIVVYFVPTGSTDDRVLQELFAPRLRCWTIDTLKEASIRSRIAMNRGIPTSHVNWMTAQSTRY